MEVLRMFNGNFQVKHDGIEEELTLDEVMFLLNHPPIDKKWKPSGYNEHAEFWKESDD